MYGISDSLLALIFIGALLFLAKMGEELFERFKLVPYVAAVFIGIVIGPGVLGLIKILPNITLFISLGINFLLFAGGSLEFKDINTKELLKVKNIIIGILEFIIPFSLISFIVYYIFHNIIVSMVTGIVTGMSSAGPLTRLLSDTGLNRTQDGNSIFRQVVAIEISAVVLFSFLSDVYREKITLIHILIIAAELFVSILLIILFGKYILKGFLEKMDISSKAHETIIAIIISFILILGFVGQYYGFNSAIVALFLGIILRDFINDRPLIAEKVSTVTYGFFEPLFFIGLGLYFVKVSLSLIILGIIIFVLGLLIKPIAGIIFSRFIGIKALRNGLGTSVNGGVDAALLVVALSISIVTRYQYSIIMFAISLLTLAVPLLFNIENPVIPSNNSRYVWNIVEQQFKNLKACDIAKTLQTVSVNKRNPLSFAFKMCMDLNARAVVVIDNNNYVLGQITLSDMISLGEGKLQTLRVYEAGIVPVIRVQCSAPATDLIRIFRDKDPPIVAVVDSNEKFVGTILEREILKYISDVLDTKN